MAKGMTEAEIRADERERIALHLDRLAEQVKGSGGRGYTAARTLAAQLRTGTLPDILIDEPGPDVRVVHDPNGVEVWRDLDAAGWRWWGGRSGSRPLWTWEQVRDGFGPLTLPPREPGGQP